MNIRVSSIIVVAVFVGFLGLSYLQMEKNRQSGAQFSLELSELDMRVKELESNLNRAQERIRELEKTSIKGVVEDANDAIIQGFGAMIGVMESELKRAREKLSGDNGETEEMPDNAAPESDENPSAPQ